ncbi:MAG: deoxyribose-phosphate aldolase [Ferruginibacter sp.]
MALASFIEHSCLSPTTTVADIERVCNEAMQYQFAGVCIPPMFVKKAKALLAGSSVKVATVTGFPFGYSAIEAKLAETVLAIVDGADEINMMINLVALKNSDWQYLAKEINMVLTVIRKPEKKIKVIIEAALLTNEEIIACCDIYGAAAVDFIQASSGYTEKQITLETFKLIRLHLSNAIQLKSGDELDAASINEWIELGADRIVCKDPVHALKAENV